MSGFRVGEVYYGTLPCAHSDFPVRVVKRTAKMVWFEHATMPQHYAPAKSRARMVSASTEACRFHGWSIWSDKIAGGDWDMQLV